MPNRVYKSNLQLLKYTKMATLFNEKETGVGDFVLLPQINMERFLENVKVRYAAGHIYTYIGKITVCRMAKF